MKGEKELRGAYPGYFDYPLTERAAEIVRKWLADPIGKPFYNVAVRSSVRVRWEQITDQSPVVDDYYVTHTFSRKQWVSPAPWAGEPFWYTWWVAEDQHGHRVAAGEAEIRYLTEWERLIKALVL